MPVNKDFSFSYSLKTLVTGVAFFVAASAVSPVQAQTSNDVVNRINQLDNQIQTLSRYVYRGGEGGETPTPGFDQMPTTGGADTSALAAGFENRMAGLEQQIQYLTGEIERIQFDARKISQENEALKARLDAIENRAANARVNVQSANNGADENALPLVNSDLDDEMATAGVDGIGDIQAEEAANVSLPSGDATGAYNAAFALLKDQNYDDAETAFTQFIKQYPASDLTDNARYWLGETYYVRGNFEKAAVVFAEAFQKAPEGSKAADNLLKLGMSLGGLGKTEDACLSFEELRKRFTSASSSIMSRLSQQEKKFSCQ